jgi:hypothetical protein
VAVDFPAVPMRVVFDSPATPRLPISMLLLPVVRLLPALKPTAMLNEPVLLKSALVVPPRGKITVHLAWFTRVRIPLGLLPVAVRLEQTLASQICLTMDEVGPRKVVIDRNKRYRGR